MAKQNKAKEQAVKDASKEPKKEELTHEQRYENALVNFNRILLNIDQLQAKLAQFRSQKTYMEGVLGGLEETLGFDRQAVADKLNAENEKKAAAQKAAGVSKRVAAKVVQAAKPKAVDKKA